MDLYTIAAAARTSPDLVRQYLAGTLPPVLLNTLQRIETALGEDDAPELDVEEAVRCLYARAGSRKPYLQACILREMADGPRRTKKLADVLGEGYTRVGNAVADLTYKGYLVRCPGGHQLGTAWLRSERTRRAPVGRRMAERGKS